MKTKVFGKGAGTLVVAAFVFGCATYTTIDHKPGTFEKVLVLVSAEKRFAKEAENQIAEGMRDRGATVVTTSTLPPPKTDASIDEGIKYLSEQGVDCLLTVVPYNSQSFVFVLNTRLNAVVRIYTNAPPIVDMPSRERVQLGTSIAATMQYDGFLTEPVRRRSFGEFMGDALTLYAQAQAGQQPSSGIHPDNSRPVLLGGVRPNAYGLGVNADQYGRPHIYRTVDGQPLDPIFQNGVKRNAYGLGVHQDQFGRPVYDSAP